MSEREEKFVDTMLLEIVAMQNGKKPWSLDNDNCLDSRKRTHTKTPRANRPTAVIPHTHKRGPMPLIPNEAGLSFSG